MTQFLQAVVVILLAWATIPPIPKPSWFHPGWGGLALWAFLFFFGL